MPIEGVWIVGSNFYEVAIIRNTTEQLRTTIIGVIAESRTESRAKGDIVLILRKPPLLKPMAGLTSIWNTMKLEPILPSPNPLEVTIADRLGGQHRTALVRNYPKESRTRFLTRSGSSTETDILSLQGRFYRTECGHLFEVCTE